jgi:hypothetical protein
MSQGGTKSKVIPFQMNHNNGIVPQHEINYTEIATMVGCSRTTAKDHCELIFRKYSDKTHAGYRVDASIPHVGKLSISIGIAAVIFNQDLID